MQHGSMSIEFYAPKKIDLQTSHVQDEIYLIANGSGTFKLDKEVMNFKTGDILFVPAGMKHRFSSFTEDFGTWGYFLWPERWGKAGNRIIVSAKIKLLLILSKHL